MNPPFDLTVMLAIRQIKQANAGCPPGCTENPWICRKLDVSTMPEECKEFCGGCR